MTVILGAGISGISAGYHLSLKGVEHTIYEQDNAWGGLCGNFEIDGFRFDKAIHLSFTENEYVKELFSKSSEYIAHKPLAYNYYKSFWLKHPAQNNLYPLDSNEKINIITDFVENKNQNTKISNYEDWLRAQYGNYFTNNFPLPYTRKYWTMEARELSTTWVGNRMYRPNIREVLQGAFEEFTPNTYYAKEMRYPKKGGYKSFLSHMVKTCNIQLNKKVVEIDPVSKKIYFQNGTEATYDNLISSIPLPEYAHLIKKLPQNIKKTCESLKYTSIALVSIGVKKPNVPNHLWFYIYDEDILPSRCYSPSMKSEDNVPEKCSSFQFEIYFSNNKPLSLSHDMLIDHVINKSHEMEVFDQNDVVVKECTILKYGNVIFDHEMENRRSTVIEYLNNLNIKTIGRFGKWDYFWSDQSLLDGKI